MGRRPSPGRRAPPGGEFVAVDWGTTHLRLRLLETSPAGGVRGERFSAEGISAVPAGEHSRVFLANLEKLLRPLGRLEEWRVSGGEVYFSGMVTSTLGWYPTPYLPVPAGAPDLLGARRVEALGKLRLHFFPGLRTGDDVLRGEEVEAIGILDRGPRSGIRSAVLVLPGTHSKWVRWERGRIRSFLTVPTGDLHAGLHRATLLARTLPPEPARIGGRLLAAFDRGLALAERDGPLASLFKARSIPVLEKRPGREASAILSGVLIGGEVLERTRGARLPPIHLGGSGPLRALYLRAFRALKVPVREVPARLAGPGVGGGAPEAARAVNTRESPSKLSLLHLGCSPQVGRVCAGAAALDASKGVPAMAVIQLGPRALVFPVLILLLLASGRIGAADCNHNGVDDREDVLQGASRDCNRNAIPDECDLAPSIAFSGARSFVTGLVDPHSVEAGDLDGDGDLDLAVANQGSDSVSILWNNGRRGFGDGMNVPVELPPSSMVLADLYGDAALDLAFGGATGLWASWNRGGRRFEPGGMISREPSITELRAADLDRDGDLDLAALSLPRWWNEPVRLLTFANDGRGVFTQAAAFDAGPGAMSLQVHDLDGDGWPDLAWSGDGTVSIRWNDGTGAGGAVLALPVGSSWCGLSLGDVDGDADLDLVLSTCLGHQEGRILVLSNQGGREFIEGVRIAIPNTPRIVVEAADMDLDGDQDLVVSGHQHRLLVFWNDGGAFPSRSEFPVSPSTIERSNLMVRDLDGDRRPDVGFVDAHSRLATVLWNDGDAILNEDRGLSVSRAPVSIAASDLDTDGDVDITIANAASDNISVLLNLGRARFAPAVSYSAGERPSSIASGDLDGDGSPDLVATDEISNHLLVFWNRGNGRFSPARSYLVGSGPRALALGDLDGDLDQDIVLVSRDSPWLLVVVNEGTGILSPRFLLLAGNGTGAVALLDVDGDGHLDVAAANQGSHDVSIYRNGGGLRFEPAASFPVQGTEPVSLVSGDLDRDGAQDLVTANRGSCSVLWNDGEGAFDSVTTIVTSSSSGSQVQVGDLDADGDLDLAIAHDNARQRLLAIWNGGGRRFSQPESIEAGYSGSPIALSDIDGDGLLDLALAGYAPRDEVAVLLSRRVPARSGDRDHDGAPDECELERFVRGNANDDGTLDLSDPLFSLAHLFLGGRAPPCPDAADADDSGSLNLSDPVFTLGYLFRGELEPPPPGPTLPGTDATPGDSLDCRTPPGPSCAALPVSTLPGVRIELLDSPCAITLGEAAALVAFRYAVVVEHDVTATFHPTTMGGCHFQGPGSLNVREVIHGNNQTYCICDVGLCPGVPESRALEPGRFEGSFEWNGRNWYGPSDFGAGYGPPFPPGRYAFELTAAGTYRDPDGVEVSFQVKARSEFELTP